MLHLLARMTSPQNLRRFSTALLAITAGMGLGAFNENIEFLLTVMLPQTGVGGYINTSLDLCSNFIGAVTAYLLFYFGVIRLENFTHSPALQDMTMTVQAISAKALAFYNEKPKQYNCAQAVAAAFDREDLIEPLKSCGGGKAPDGLCGALYAATLIAGEEKSESIKKQFQEIIGGQECKVIKQVAKTPCSDCVQCAARLVEKLV